MKLKRRTVRKKTRAEYPQAIEVQQDRRRFLGLLGKGLLGAAVLGLTRCDDDGERVPIGGEDVEPMDLQTPDHTEDWNLQGGAPPPEEIREGDILSCPTDTEGEFPPLAGEPMPPEDIKEDDVPPLPGEAPPDIQEEDIPPLAGDMPAPDVVPQDIQGETDSDEFPPMDGDTAIPE